MPSMGERRSVGLDHRTQPSPSAVPNRAGAPLVAGRDLSPQCTELIDVPVADKHLDHGCQIVCIPLAVTPPQSFRNLIHPGRAARLAQTCDRATALSAIGALEHVVRGFEILGEIAPPIFCGSPHIGFFAVATGSSRRLAGLRARHCRLRMKRHHRITPAARARAHTARTTNLFIVSS